MPENVIKHLIYTKGIYDVDKLAEAFCVSTGAVYYHLKNLKII